MNHLSSILSAAQASQADLPVFASVAQASSDILDLEEGLPASDFDCQFDQDLGDLFPIH